MATDRTTVLVVGGGIIGSSVAYYLTRQGVGVHLLEAGAGPSSTTRASLGVLTHFNGGDNPYSAFYRDGLATYEVLSRELQEETGIDIGWRPLGGLNLICTDEDEAEAEELLRFNQERGCPAERVDAAQVRRLEPRLSSRVRGGVYFPGDQQVDPENLCRGMLQAVEQGRGRISYGEALEGFEEVTDDGVVVRTSRGTRAAEFLVLAAGSWTGELGEQLGVRIPVRPVRGQHCRVGVGGELHHILRHGGYHLVPGAGQILVGSTVEEVGFAPDTTPEAARQFEAVQRQILDLPPEPVEQRAGLRPKPKGGRPLIGPLGAYPRIFAATGHYKNGILMGPITGQVISEWIAGGQPSRDMSYFAAER